MKCYFLIFSGVLLANVFCHALSSETIMALQKAAYSKRYLITILQRDTLGQHETISSKKIQYIVLLGEFHFKTQYARDLGRNVLQQFNVIGHEHAPRYSDFLYIMTNVIQNEEFMLKRLTDTLPQSVLDATLRDWSQMDCGSTLQDIYGYFNRNEGALDVFSIESQISEKWQQFAESGRRHMLSKEISHVCLCSFLLAGLILLFLDHHDPLAYLCLISTILPHFVSKLYLQERLNYILPKSIVYTKITPDIYEEAFIDREIVMAQGIRDEIHKRPDVEKFLIVLGATHIMKVREFLLNHGFRDASL